MLVSEIDIKLIAIQIQGDQFKRSILHVIASLKLLKTVILFTKGKGIVLFALCSEFWQNSHKQHF